MRQICCHPALVNSDYQGTSGKFEYFKRMLERALSNHRRILVFSQFTSMLAIMQDYLDQEAINYFIIEGKTNKEKRQDQVNRFNQGEGSVFLISLRAGGVGINLTGADTVFLYDLWWNPSVEEQAIGRAHRIGQTKDVEVYRFITEGTIEERIAELQEEKRHLFDELFQDEEMGESSHLTMDDLRFILDMPAS
ncbi:DEAD/DEAH box helicase [Aerococcus sp. Group 1]|uniref:DEAD/DEAH box helicase n=1 Tax=Aerococcus urinae (strain CCUG 59500 / ACS-120-V-Col10a) TaxID=2976812 RepID=UPI00227B7405|nr:C-terminal helicase domain-containing protein [Aerococcus sp. Group 1]MCY3062605.1 SWF/SNF helicase family protein [Aerococcus sp. Group 1]